MEFATKLRALERLAMSRTAAARAALRMEFEHAARTLTESSAYDELNNALAVIRSIGFTQSKDAIESLLLFVGSVEKRTLIQPEDLRGISVTLGRFRSSESLITHAIDAMGTLRYVETGPVLRSLLDLSTHSSDALRKKSLEALGELAQYDLAVFYGRGDAPGIGAAPQLLIANEIESIQDHKIREQFEGVLKVLTAMLSPTMEGVAWSHSQLTISQTATPGHPSIGTVRAKTIAILIKVFGIVLTANEKLCVIAALKEATRNDPRSSRDGASIEMYVRDAKRVLSFFSEALATSELPVVQRIEHDSYWIHYHAISNEVREEALRVRDLITKNHEYEIYKNLVGFEGVFDDWEIESPESRFSDIERLRRENAVKYAQAIDEASYAEWRDRILRYAKVQSNDLATFPVFYFFLEEFASTNPALALRLLSQQTEGISRFMIPLLRGLWAGPQHGALRTLIVTWIADGRYLYALARQFLENPAIDIAFAEVILERAIDLEDTETILQIVSVAVSNFKRERTDLVDQLFLPALEALTARRLATWVFDSWFRRQLKDLLSEAVPNVVDAILRNLVWLDRFDYHAEEVLSLIAENHPERIFDYFVSRIQNAKAAAAVGRTEYEALPFALSKLQESLSRFPDLAVEKFRAAYDGNFSVFVNDGGRFLTRIFPEVGRGFESELLRLVDRGDRRDIEFVLAVLRNYRGEVFTHGLAKALVSLFPPESELLNEVAIALDSTGVVSGEFGFALAYEQKIEDIKPWLSDENERVRAFAKSYSADLERMATEERGRAEESIALRKHRYGES